MNFDIVSDLHIHDVATLEHILHKMKESINENLIVGGDTTDNIFTTINVINEFKKHYKNVFTIMGNHDHYLGSIKSINDELIKLNDKSFFNTENRYQIIDNTVVIGFTGWYDLKCYEQYGFKFDQAKEVWKELRRDSHWINFEDDLFPWEYAEQEKHELTNLINIFNNDPSIDNIVIVTHMIPSRMFVNPRNIPQWDMATPSYVNSFMLEDISKLKTNKIKLWVYGHTHDRSNFVNNGIKFINNARGYGKEINNWDIFSYTVC